MAESITQTRRCSACRETKHLSNFPPGKKDYLCKPCKRAYDEKRKGRGRPRNDTEAARSRKRRWAALNKDATKYAARQAVRKAILRGEIIPQDSCEACGGSPRRSDGARAVQAHHDDYSIPLAVRWLCAKCHTQWHKQNDAALALPAQGEGENG